MDKVMLGNRVRLARKDAGLTGEKLSEMCNINAAYLRQIECGVKMPSLPLFESLCSQLGVSPTYLLADALPSSGSRDLDALLEMCKCASPQQIDMVAFLLRAFTEYLAQRDDGRAT